jgi:hypothetical protein
MPPTAALDRSFHCIGRCSIGEHYETIAKVLMDVATDECIHLMTPGGDSSDLLLR